MVDFDNLTVKSRRGPYTQERIDALLGTDCGIVMDVRAGPPVRLSTVRDRLGRAD